MVRSCLIAPLVKPLVGRGAAGVGRRSAIGRSRILGTALALSALCSVSTMADAARETLEAEARKSKIESNVKANAHRAPKKIAARVLLDRFLALVAAREDDIVSAPGEAPEFDNDAIALLSSRHRLRHLGFSAPGCAGLALASRVDRLHSGADPTYFLFGSAQHLSGIPTS